MRIGTRTAGTALAMTIAGGMIAFAQNGTPLNPNSKNVLTVAVYGDAPYGVNPTDTSETDAMHSAAGRAVSALFRCPRGAPAAAESRNF